MAIATQSDDVRPAASSSLACVRSLRRCEGLGVAGVIEAFCARDSDSGGGWEEAIDTNDDKLAIRRFGHQCEGLMTASARQPTSCCTVVLTRRPVPLESVARWSGVLETLVRRAWTAGVVAAIKPSHRHTRWTLVSRLVVAVAICLLSANRGATQTIDPETRAAVIANQQLEKARDAAPYKPNRAEAILQRFEEEGFPFIGTPPGFYPALSSVYPGGRLAFGGGYRTFTGSSALLDVHALYSIATYKRIEATFRSPGHARGRIEFGARAGWLDAPRVSYFGLGSDTVRQDGTAFRIRESYGEGTVSWRPLRWFELSTLGAYEQYNESAGTGRKASIEERFTSATAPRLGEDPAFARSATTASLLWTATPAYSRRGGFLQFTYDGRARVDGDGGFGIARTEIVQHIPLLRETWVVSLRGRTDGVVGRGSNAPYFLLPSLGSGSTLRAYQTDRFRDLHSVLLTGEWRWIPSRLALDMALFVDAGRVGPTWKDVTSGGLKTDYGIGVRFHAPAATALRIDLARGSEGMRLVFATSAPF